MTVGTMSGANMRSLAAIDQPFESRQQPIAQSVTEDNRSRGREGGDEETLQGRRNPDLVREEGLVMLQRKPMFG